MSPVPEKPVFCYNCFQEKSEAEGPCPYCGFDLAENEKKFPVALRAGTVLNDRYIIGRVLGQGGFGITYLALDTQLNAKVAIKEFMPGEIATRQGTTVSVLAENRSEEFAYGAERFQEEARTLAKFIGNPNIAGVSSYFDENDTSYFVMDYIEGISFKTYIANHGGKISVEETLNVMIPVLRALTAVHAEGFIHRDVTPDNIYITKDGMVKLLDFGSARYSIGDKSKSLDVILKVGYAPKEQYIRRSRQGPFTDVYSCAACFYAAITGFLPPESLERLDHDELVPISQCGIDIPEYLDKAILKGLAVQPEDRFQSAAEFLDAIEQQQIVEVPVSGGAAAPATAGGQLDALIAKIRQKPKLYGAIAAAAVVVLVALTTLTGGGGSGRGGGDLLPTEVPSITIAGQEYSTDEKNLDLQGMGLTDADIQDLKYMVNLYSLNLRENNITDVSCLTELPRLESLQLSDNSITDLSPLADMTELIDLYVNGNDITDLSPLAEMTQMRYIDVGNNPNLTDLSPLSGMTELENINFQNVPVTDFSFLSGMTELENLNFNAVPAGADLSPLANLSKVKSLYIQGSDAPIGDLSFLSGMTGLQDLYIYGVFEELTLPDLSGLTQLTMLQIYPSTDYVLPEVDLSPLQGVTSLQSLTLNVNTTAALDLTPLAGMTEMRELTLNSESTAPMDLSPLSGMTSMQSLSIRGNIQSTAPLLGMADMQTLSLSNNDNTLTDLSGLANMSKVQELRLSVGNVQDFSPLAGMTGLRTLSLNGDYYTDSLDFLKGMTQLQELDIYTSGEIRVQDLTAFTDLTALTALRLDTTGLTSLHGLEGLTKLQELNLSGTYASYPDLDPLANLTQLQTLRLPSYDADYDDFKSFNIDALANLKNLQDLQISGTPDSLEGLRGLTNLQTLNINGASGYAGPALDLSPLGTLTSLTDLQISNFRALNNDLTALGNLTSLRDLWVSVGSYQEKVRSIAPLGNLTNLTQLSVYNTVDGIDTSMVSFVPDLYIG